MKNKLPKKDKGLGFLRHWKVMTMTLLLLTFSIGQMWGQDVTLADINYTQWDGTAMPANSGLSNSNTYYASNGTSRVATLVGKGCKLDDSSNQPTATGVSGSYEHYLRFGSSGNYLNITASNDLVKNAGETSYGKVRFLVSSQKNKTTDELAEVKIGETSLGKIYAFTSTSTCDWVEFDIPATVSKNATITLTRTTNTLFVWGIQIKTFTSSSSPVSVTGITLAPSSATIKVGKTVTLVPTITPSDATDKAVTWAVTSGSSYASVTDAGVVTGLAAGTAVVTATAHDGSGVTQTATITVEDCPTSGTLFSMTITDPDGTVYTDVTNAAPQLIGATYVGGKAYATSTSSSKRSPKITGDEFDFNVSSSSSVAVKVELDCPLAEGDIISFTSTHTKEFKIQKVAGTNLHQTSSLSLAIPSGSSLIDEDVFYVLCANSACSFSEINIIRPIYRTITLEYADGETPDGSLEVVDGTAATKPADPTWAHHRFDGWYDGSDPYDWSETVGGDLTLTAHWTQLYTITFANGGGTGDAPAAVADKAQGETFSVPANTFTPPTGQVFDHWNDGTNDYNQGDTYTVGTNNVTLTAVWRTPSTMYAITKGAHENGDFTIDPASQEAGEVVTLEATPNDGYLFGSWEVVKTEDASATGITVDANGQFTMPGYAVTVNATFVADTRKKILYVTGTAEETVKANDKLYAALKDDYRVTIVGPTSDADQTSYDLVVLHESVGGGNYGAAAVAAAKAGNTPVLNTKTYFYGNTNDASQRWQWGAPNAGQTVNGATLNSAYCNVASHPLFSGVTMTAGFFEITDAAAAKCMQPIGSFTSGKEGYILATTPNAGEGNGCAIHELTPAQRGASAGKYLMISVSNAKLDALNANGQKLFQNAADYLINGTAWEPATVPTSPAIEATGGAIHAVGDAVTMTASASNVSATTLYAWYKGETLEAAEEAGAIQTAKTAAADGTTYSIGSCELESAGTYWCVIVNAEGCEASASLELSVSSTPIDTYDITYVSAKGTAPDPENAASVTLAEITGVSGWEHQGWKANVDVVVDDATVTANTLIANGKTAVLSADVTFTAVWRQVLTVTYNANGGTCGTASATWGEGDAALVLPDATVANLVFDGWYTEATGGTLVGRAGGTYTPTADIEIFAHFGAKLYQAVYANGFDAFINQSAKTVTVYYLDGTPAPALTSVKAMKADGTEVAAGTFVDKGSTIDVTIDEKTATYTVNKTAVAPYTYVSDDAVVFDGTETYVKTGNSFSTDAGKLGWKFSKNDDDWIRETPGNNRIYFFIGAAESVTFTTGCTSDRSAKFYRNGELIKTETIAKNTGAVTVAGSNAPAMYAVVSNQTSGDGSIKSMTLAPWVPVTAVALKEGTTPISEKEIWASASFTLTAEVTPDNASNKTITWTSSNEAIATVTDGVVTGVAANASPVTITASTVDGVTATCAVTVTAAPEPCETPVITADPATQAYCAGSEPTLTVAANDPSDGGTLHYAWYKVGDPDAAVGTDAASYTVESAGTYYVIVTNKKDGSLDASATSSNAVVTMNVAAEITTQPTNKRDIASGSEVTLSVVATNATGYQWYICDDAEKANASAISGAEAADYVFNCSASAYYYCVVGSACGDDITSNVVSVKLEPANCNLIASTPAEEPYQYVQTGEWTLYGIDSNGKLATSSKFKDDAKDFDGNTVNAIADQRVGMIFDKDIESLTIYATSGSTGRTWKGDQQIRVTSDDITSGSPSYTNVTATRAVATMPTNNKQYIFTADEMLIEAGKKVWLPFSGSITIFKICYTAALEKCDAPVLPSLASKELCEGEAITAWDATSTVSDGGTLSYQWYNGDTDEALSGEDDAEFTPSADGNYYVIVTNKKTGYRDNTTKSATLSVEHFAGTAVTTAPANVRKSVGEDATLEVVATGKNLSYVWYTCDDAEGNNPVAIDPAETNATLNVMVPDGIQWYKVVVSSDCGADLSAVAKVEKFVALPQLHITGTTNWDLTTCADAEIKLTSTTSPKKGEECLMANIEGVHLDANFNSQALVMSGEYIYRTSVTGNPTCAEYMKFITDVEGVVTVTFAGNGSNRLIRVTGANGVQYSTVSTGTGDTHTEKFYVTPGEVELMGMNSAKTSDKQYMRFFSISFNATPNYTRPVTQGRFGTICLPNGGVMVGAALFEVAYHDATLEKIFFDEILNGEMVAGRPYIFLPNDGVSALGVYYTDAADEAAGNYHGLYGSYTQQVLAQEAGNYILYNNQYMYVGASSSNVSVGANRAYFKIGVEGGIPTNAVAPLPGRRRVSMSAVRETPTGLENGELINGENGVQKVLINGELFILRGEKMYDATGRLVK